MGKGIFWVELLSVEFPWLESIISQGKAIVLFSHKHKHMYKVHVYTQPYAHAQPHNVFNAIYRTVPHYGLIYITLTKTRGFPPTRDLTRGEVAALRMWNDLGAIGTQHEHIITAKRCELAVYPAKVTGDLLTNGPTTRHRWLPWKGSQVHQRVLCWSQMWFRLECGIGGTLLH